MLEINEKTVDALTGLRFQNLRPLPQFKEYAEQYGGNVFDDPAYYQPVYPDFDDFDYRHDTNKIKPVYLNDFDFCLEEDRQKIAALIRMDFDTETFETVAQCLCGALKGNHTVGSTQICKKCGEKPVRLVESDLETKVWLRLPEGVRAFINPGFFKTFFSRISTRSPKINIVTWLIDSSYRRKVGAKNEESGRRMLAELDKLGIEPNLNSFIDNADRFMEHFLIGEGLRIISLTGNEGKEYLKLYYKYRDVVFPKYLPVSNRFATIIEKNGNDRYVAANQLKLSNNFQSIADTRDSDQHYRITPDDIAQNIDIVGKALVKMSVQNSENLHDNVFQKHSVIRKHAIAGSLPFSGRSVITSTTGIHDPSVVKIPRIMMIAMLKTHILSHLYRQGFSPLKALKLIGRAAANYVHEIDTFIRAAESRRDILGILGRQPSIQYLSVRAFYLEMNEDMEDESINLPILSVGPFNADFDGDQMTVYLLSDLLAKARAYGSFGHQSMLDENNPFTVSRFANQTSTILMNINSVLRSTPIS